MARSCSSVSEPGPCRSIVSIVASSAVQSAPRSSRKRRLFKSAMPLQPVATLQLEVAIEERWPDRPGRGVEDLHPDAPQARQHQVTLTKERGGDYRARD